MAEFLLRLSIVLIGSGITYHIMIPKKQGQAAVAKNRRILSIRKQRELTESERYQLSSARFWAWPIFWRNKLIIAGIAVFIINIAILEVKRWLN